MMTPTASLAVIVRDTRTLDNFETSKILGADFKHIGFGGAFAPPPQEASWLPDPILTKMRERPFPRNTTIQYRAVTKDLTPFHWDRSVRHASLIAKCQRKSDHVRTHSSDTCNKRKWTLASVRNGSCLFVAGLDLVVAKPHEQGCRSLRLLAAFQWCSTTQKTQEP
mgnify:CR=1 FL=1